MTATIGNIGTDVFTFPTPEPEADGTLTWAATTAVTVQVEAGGRLGLGWTYSAAAAASVVHDVLIPSIGGRDPFDVAGAWSAMHRACRNIGTKGLVMQAISAVDIALWDLKARLLEVPLGQLLGQVRETVPVYGSGGFTTLGPAQLAEQVQGWADAGCTAMKIKIGQDWGTDPDRDLHRVRRLRKLAGPEVALMVDANGGYTVGQARRVGRQLDELGVVWFEEPVSSDDLGGLAAVRAGVRCDVAAGEYVSDLYDAAHLLPVVDCLQLDVTRCGGYTGWLRGAALAAARNIDVSAHCAPSLHASVSAAVPNLRHVEWFIDHARLEPLLVEGVPPVAAGRLHPSAGGTGHGMKLRADARRHQHA
ncbi:L-alanine-DL-glutamate epimerase [Nakamurella panacisegetis]|uniref:L-alanine-DL-glutamate epimerase n=1 Tax=Nakamurella panacisegetis TaxID=1090615 RepID=A0A1H0IZ33_9ACTN|nr:enolase C-terminal domain-like protein [Nakamurella panacisegetis]SDO36603.1 L-alanine-DL-glutamate epimerase [Nakamurella panacisegetis]